MEDHRLYPEQPIQKDTMPVGTCVVFQEGGQQVPSKTRTAVIPMGGTLAVWLEGWVGAVPLSSISLCPECRGTGQLHIDGATCAMGGWYDCPADKTEGQ